MTNIAEHFIVLISHTIPVLGVNVITGLYKIILMFHQMLWPNSRAITKM